MLTEIVLRPIGTVHSPFKEPPGTPIQPGAAAGIQGMVEVFPEYGEGLKDLEGFSHLILLYYFHLAPGFSLLVQPFLDDQKRGLFATRAPARPNPIGISTVRLETRRRHAALHPGGGHRGRHPAFGHQALRAPV